jgi:hypothetical protein
MNPHEKTHTLTCPQDLPPGGAIESLDPTAPELTQEQQQAALTELYDTTFVTRFPRVEKRFADVPIPELFKQR